MGIFDNFRQALGLSSLNRHKRREYAADFLRGEPIYSNANQRKENLEGILPNIKRVQTPVIENSQTVLQEIEELQNKIHDDIYSQGEKEIFKKHLILLYEKYEQLCFQEKNTKKPTNDYTK